MGGGVQMESRLTIAVLVLQSGEGGLAVRHASVAMELESELKSIAKSERRAYKEGEGLLELGDLFFGEGVGLFMQLVSCSVLSVSSCR